jgi:hypothetical protein
MVERLYRNVGAVDRLMRLYVSLFAFAAAYLNREAGGVMLCLMGTGLYYLLSAFLRWDPFYLLIGK